MVLTGNEPGDTATYSCDANFELSGEQVLTCGNNGMWSADPPTCIRKLFFNLNDVFCLELKNLRYINEETTNIHVVTVHMLLSNKADKLLLVYQT